MTSSRRLRVERIGLFAGLVLAPAGAAFAGEGRPQNWQIGFQKMVTPIGQQMEDFNNLLLVIMAIVVAFVLALLVWVIIRYNEKANPVPTRTSHNTVLEVAWTVIPVLILLLIAVPSFRLLYAQYAFPPADLTIKVTGNQWFWKYTYPDSGNFSFDAYMLDDKELKPGQPKLLAVDNEVVVPVGKSVHMLVAANDVIHSWAIPSFGVKTDAVPGRVSRTWFKALEPGVYYGQCQELCGTNHAFMPIAVRVLSEQDFAAWVESAKKKFAASIPGAQLAKLQDGNAGQQSGGADGKN
jgi:cytochrome c oxidase subunit 2